MAEVVVALQGKSTTESAMNLRYVDEHQKVSVADFFIPVHRALTLFSVCSVLYVVFKKEIMTLLLGLCNNHSDLAFKDVVKNAV